MMTSTQPQVDPEGRYSHCEAARKLGINRNTLRLHREQGHIRCNYRSDTYRPFYLGSEILKFWRAQL